MDGDSALHASEKKGDARPFRGKVVFSRKEKFPTRSPWKCLSSRCVALRGRDRRQAPPLPNATAVCFFFFPSLVMFSTRKKGAHDVTSKVLDDVPAAGGQPKVGPPGGKWMWEKRAERVAAARETSATVTPTSTPARNSKTTSDRVLVDKCIGTESRSQEQEFLTLLASMIHDFIQMQGNRRL